MKLVTVVGARPQFIKAATVSRAVRGCSDMSEVIVHTGQHYDDTMSDIFFRQLDIPRPDINLGVGSARHGAQTGRMLEALEDALEDQSPDWVIVYGDTNSTLAGAIAAAKLNMPVAHVEAGLRSYNRRMPEEVNRVLADHVSELLFAPTETAVRNLRGEGISDQNVRLVGDVMYDAALFYAEKAERESRILSELGLEHGTYILSTVHRQENTDNPSNLSAIFMAMAALAKRVPVVVPLHPRTLGALRSQNLLAEVERQLLVVQPLGYLDMIMLEKNARLIATDSGGIQKEAFFCRVPCVTLRGETEWTELVTAGWNKCVDPSRGAHDVEDEVGRWLDDFEARSSGEALYGDGDAAVKVLRHLETWK